MEQATLEKEVENMEPSNTICPYDLKKINPKKAYVSPSKTFYCTEHCFYMFTED